MQGIILHTQPWLHPSDTFMLLLILLLLLQIAGPAASCRSGCICSVGCCLQLLLQAADKPL
jgi:hypothetical protein